MRIFFADSRATITDVDVIDESYWLVTLGGLSANNDSISLGTSNKAAIDTGTTLIGGPDSVVSSFYSKIAGSAPMSGSEGYYTYPCNSDVSVTMTFGNQQYSLNSADFEAGTVDSSGTSCLGALFELGATSSSTLNWIIGDAFLKNVYSIFTASGSSAKVGFAKLAEGLNDGGTSAKTVAQTSGSNDSSPAITLGAPKMASSLIAATAVVALTVALAAF